MNPIPSDKMTPIIGTITPIHGEPFKRTVGFWDEHKEKFRDCYDKFGGPFIDGVKPNPIPKHREPVNLYLCVGDKKVDGAYQVVFSLNKTERTVREVL